MALTSTFRIGLEALRTNPLDLSTPEDKLQYAKSIALATGTGANQSDMIFHDQRTLAPSATEDLDLAGTLTGPLGIAAVFVKLKAIIVFAAIANTNAVRVTRPAANGVPLFLAVSDGLDVLPGGVFLWISPGAGVTVTAATGDLITITNSAGGTSVVYDIILVGTSA